MKSNYGVNFKRLRDDNFSDMGPNAKCPRLDGTKSPATLSTEKLKAILSTKSFYGKSSPAAEKIVIVPRKFASDLANTNQMKQYKTSRSKNSIRRPGQINFGVKHKIKKPKVVKKNTQISPDKVVLSRKAEIISKELNDSVVSNKTDDAQSDNTLDNTKISQDDDPFDMEKQTIDVLLSQWTEEDIPESEMVFTKSSVTVPCFNDNVIEATEQIFQPIMAVPVNTGAVQPNSEVIVELGAGEFDLVAAMKDLPAPSATEADTSPKLFPIFSNPNPGPSFAPTKTPSKCRKTILKNLNDQYVIDAGQRRFGATQCSDCGVIYEIGDPEDEHAHEIHHNAEDIIKFNELKSETVVGSWGEGRCIRLKNTEVGWKRVENLLNRVIHPQLGYCGDISKDIAYTAFLYIEKKMILGCAIVEPRDMAYKMLSGELDCCSLEEYPVKVGVSRLWTHVNHRRRGIAARLMDCVRAASLPGQALMPLEVAVSAPTNAGKDFAKSYFKTENFFVYLV